MNKVSVIMPVYNAEKFLKEAIDSILAQSYSDWELIIINDGSTDNSEKIILNTYSDERIKYYANTTNRGLIYTRSFGISQASFPLIAFLDSDDIALPERLKTQVEFLDSNLEYALCGTWGICIDSDGSFIKKINLPIEDQEIKAGLLFANTFIQSSIMIRKCVLENITFSPDFPVAEDYDLWCRLALNYKLYNIPKHLVKYRWHNDNISLHKAQLMNDRIRTIFLNQLNGIGINASEEELDIHMLIRDHTYMNISQDVFFKKHKVWLCKLIAMNVKSSKYDNPIFEAMVYFRWMFVCKERKKYIQILYLIPCLISKPKTLCLLLKLLNDRSR